MDLWRSILTLAAAGAFVGIAAFDVGRLLHHAWRLAALEALAVSGVLVWLVTESLSAFRAISLVGLAGSWGLAAAAAIAIAARSSHGHLGSRFSEDFRNLGRRVWSLPVPEFAVLGFMLLGGLILALIAFAAAPNTWDSLTYHLSRIMHWQQNQSLAFYATAIQRQLSFGPLAEMAMLQFQVLTGTDRLANFVQFFAMIGCAVGASLIAERLGGDLRSQIFTALATVTLPMGVLQATSTQNDYVVALWCVSLVVFVLIQFDAHGTGWWAVACGAVLGLGVLTKATALLFLAPIGVWHSVRLFQSQGRRAWYPLVVLLAVATIIATPHSLRNWGLYGNPLGITSGREPGSYTNRTFTLRVLASNMLRDLGLQLASPVEGINQAIEAGILRAHRLIGSEPNDPATTWEGMDFEMVFSMYEDNAGSPLHVLLVLGAAILLVWHRGSLPKAYGCAVGMGFVLFCLVLKWQPWNSRLMMPVLILAMPVVGVTLSARLKGTSIYLLGLIVAVVAIPYLVLNPTRPLIGHDSVLFRDRMLQYFANVPDDATSYEAAARMLRDANCSLVGLASPTDGREYLLWVTNRVFNPAVQIEHVMVKNISRRYAVNFTPCAIVVTYPVQESELRYQNTDYVTTLSTERFSLFLRPLAPP